MNGGRRLNCPQCGKPLPKTDGVKQQRVCANCGKEIKGMREIHSLIQSNAKEIAADYLALGLTDTMAKWGISATPIYRLPEVRALKGKYSRLLHKRSCQDIGLPVFSNEWDKEVQLKWLELYKETMKGAN